MQITINLPDDTLPIGTKVYIPRAAIHSVIEDEIKGYHCTLFNENDKPTLVISDYRLSTINLGSDNLITGWAPDEIFLSYEGALTMAVEYTVEATPEEWLNAIGLDGSEGEDRSDLDEDCELSPCCSVISKIRDMLYNVCKTGKINAVARKRLATLLESHEAVTGDCTNLTKILSQINITWTNIKTN